MSYSYNKFLRPITSSDKNIKILDDTNDIKYTIDPFAIQNVSISNNILKINLKSKSILIDFSSINEAKLGLIRIKEQIDTLIKNIPHLIDRDVQNYVDSIFSKVSIRRHSFTNFDGSNCYDYNGYAPVGSSESSNVWTITRLTINAFGSVTRGTTSSVAWTNRLTVIYT